MNIPQKHSPQKKSTNLRVDKKRTPTQKIFQTNEERSVGLWGTLVKSPLLDFAHDTREVKKRGLHHIVTQVQSVESTARKQKKKTTAVGSQTGDGETRDQA